MSEENKSEVSMNLYDMNKQLIKQMDLYTEAEIQDAIEILNDWHISQPHEFYMLYGRELNYFTLFREVNYDCIDVESDFETFGNAVMALLNDISAGIYSIDYVAENNAYEFWIKTADDDATVLYLFDYTTGVVTFG